MEERDERTSLHQGSLQCPLPHICLLSLPATPGTWGYSGDLRLPSEPQRVAMGNGELDMQSYGSWVGLQRARFQLRMSSRLILLLPVSQKKTHWSVLLLKLTGSALASHPHRPLRSKMGGVEPSELVVSSWAWGFGSFLLQQEPQQ